MATLYLTTKAPYKGWGEGARRLSIDRSPSPQPSPRRGEGVTPSLPNVHRPIQRTSPFTESWCQMFELMLIYRLLAFIVAGMMVFVLWRERDWRQQLFAALVFVPFILRATGVK